MSKSLGNYFVISGILEHHDPVALRQLFLASHYRSPMDFSREGLEEAGKAVDRIYETTERVARGRRQENDAPEPALIDAFRQEMDDDFNTPRALALIFDEVRALNRLLDEKESKGLDRRAAALRSMCSALGLLQKGYFERKKRRWLKQGLVSLHEIEELISRRDAARKEKHWQQADRIRQELNAKGIVIEDTPGGTIWKLN
jgi:cysteinyl-tRNA synthetase